MMMTSRPHSSSSSPSSSGSATMANNNINNNTSSNTSTLPWPFSTSSATTSAAAAAAGASSGATPPSIIATPALDFAGKSWTNIPPVLRSTLEELAEHVQYLSRENKALRKRIERLEQQQ